MSKTILTLLITLSAFCSFCQEKEDRILYIVNEVTVMVAKDNVPISKEDSDKICVDLKLGYELGDRKAMVIDA